MPPLEGPPNHDRLLTFSMPVLPWFRRITFRGESLPFTHHDNHNVIGVAPILPFGGGKRNK